jgi:hypothetical protein
MNICLIITTKSLGTCKNDEVSITLTAPSMKYTSGPLYIANRYRRCLQSLSVFCPPQVVQFSSALQMCCFPRSSFNIFILFIASRVLAHFFRSSKRLDNPGFPAYLSFSFLTHVMIYCVFAASPFLFFILALRAFRQRVSSLDTWQ